MDTPGPQPVTGCNRSHRAMAVFALASLVLTTGCASAPSLDDASPAVEAANVSPGGSPVTTTSPATDGASLPTLNDVLAQDRFVPLAVALERGGLDQILDGLDDFVLLAPVSAAFTSSGADIGIEYSRLMNDPRLLEALLRYHVVANPSTNQSWRTLNGSALDVDGFDADTIVRVDNVEVLDRIHVRNGTVLVMPRLLLPVAEASVTSTGLQQP